MTSRDNYYLLTTLIIVTVLIIGAVFVKLI